MKPDGSFYPLAGDNPAAPAVLFAYVVDTPNNAARSTTKPWLA